MSLNNIFCHNFISVSTQIPFHAKAFRIHLHFRLFPIHCSEFYPFVMHVEQIKNYYQSISQES